ncbi:regulator of G-protein signaling [Acrasis kona]|uniref:Regulator of G-protein signaling n=1 Tax=Acrasis kona TaxID=1008807 RepID=A0AAW2YN09_9EUKA
MKRLSRMFSFKRSSLSVEEAIDSEVRRWTLDSNSAKMTLLERRNERIKKMRETSSVVFHEVMSGSLLQRMLREDNNFHDTLMIYCESECSQENLQMWDMLQIYGDLKNGEEKLELFNNLYQNFIHQAGDKQVNLSHDIITKVDMYMQNEVFTGAEMDKELIVSLELATIENLLDSYDRFINNFNSVEQGE